MAIKRLYVHETIYDDMVSELVELAAASRLGDGLHQETDMGPVNDLAQLERVMEITEDARKHGAEIVTGGKRLDRPGYFFPPTIVTNITDGVRLVDEEQFGPVLPVYHLAASTMPLHEPTAPISDWTVLFGRVISTVEWNWPAAWSTVQSGLIATGIFLRTSLSGVQKCQVIVCKMGQSGLMNLASCKSYTSPSNL
jgi:hypothetical protein